MDRLYGHPGHETLYGREAIHAAIAEKGLDKALMEDFGETGRLIKEYLTSTNPAEYFVGTYLLYLLYYDGGHTTFDHGDMNGVFNLEAVTDLYNSYINIAQNIDFSPFRETLYHSYDFTKKLGLAKQRDEIYGIETIYIEEMSFSGLISSQTYIRQGDTAVCILNSFTIDTDAWDAYYAGQGPLPTPEKSPTDTLAVFLDAVNQAQADPEIRNLVIDISTNMGGVDAMMMAVLSLITGRSGYCYENVLTGQKSCETYAADRNFDGVFDERDANVHFDLNFAVLTSSYAFSAGNLFSSHIHDAGYPLFGERSGGGACVISVMDTADGFDYVISSNIKRSTNEAGENVDSGIPVDKDLVNRDRQLEFEIDFRGDRYPVIMADYSAFYDIENLSRLVREAYTIPEPLNRIEFFRIDDLSRLEDSVLPKTGFSLQHPGTLKEQPLTIRYQPTHLMIRIPTLSVASDILMVPSVNNEYPVEWLGSEVGMLEGSRAPGEGIAVLTGHNHLNTMEAGPFAFLGSLEIGDRIMITDENGDMQIYRVSKNTKVPADGFAEISADVNEKSLILITCEDESVDGDYLNRRIILTEPVI